MASITFEPRIGSLYTDKNRFGVCVLVLGESHVLPSREMAIGARPAVIAILPYRAPTEPKPDF